jgi:hypothetical protein
LHLTIKTARPPKTHRCSAQVALAAFPAVEAGAPSRRPAFRPPKSPFESNDIGPYLLDDRAGGRLTPEGVGEYAETATPTNLFRGHAPTEI